MITPEGKWESEIRPLVHGRQLGHNSEPRTKTKGRNSHINPSKESKLSYLRFYPRRAASIPNPDDLNVRYRRTGRGTGHGQRPLKQESTGSDPIDLKPSSALRTALSGLIPRRLQIPGQGSH
ncbi:hypothetical protein H0G86_003165 [Trichoderma simmonsii]|uniref:Uncharacterized protein n=1 Tax=Trichoderma simmonsii TaxID=1491479 RepID=A0A8G0PE59_9HYPO|nr:hypothetical protein H0G86_003165 [Trichoderma simmonsii]